LFPKVYIFNTREFTLQVDDGVDAKGMVVYNNNASLSGGAGLYAWNGSEWKCMSAGSANSCIPVTATAISEKTGNNAKITVNVTAGNPTFSYVWTKEGYPNPVRTTANVSATSDSYTTTGEGIYTVTVTNPCTATPISFTFEVSVDGETLVDNGNDTKTDSQGNLVYKGETYAPIESDVPGIYLDKEGEIVYTGADGVPNTDDDNVFVVPDYPLPKQETLFSIVKPVWNGMEENTNNTQLELDFATPYSGKIKYISSNPSFISVDQNGILTASAARTGQTIIAVILEDGSFTSKGFDLQTASSMNAAGAKLASVSPGNAPYLVFPDSTLKIGVTLKAQNSSGNVWRAKSITYTMQNAGATGSTVTPGGWFIAGSTAGTATVEAEVEDGDGAKLSTTITVEIVGALSDETKPETVSTDWASLEPASDYAGGNGTEANPYRISCLRQLKKLSYDIKLLGAVEATYQKYYQLTTDLDFTGDNTVTRSLVDGTFYGSFDGLGHIIKGLRINPGNEVVNDIGIIARVSYGEIKNLGREGGSTTAPNGNFVGGIVGSISNSIVSNCFNTSNISVLKYAGGIAGAIYNRSIIENCYNTGEIFCPNVAGSAAGITGYVVGGATTAIIANVYNTGKVNAFDYSATLVGNMRNGSSIMHTLELNNCYNFSDIDTGTATGSRSGIILGYIQNSEPELTNIIATNVYSKPEALILNGVPTSRLIGWSNSTQKTNIVDKLVAANPTMKEDAKYTLGYSQSAAFATELGDAFKYVPERTPKLAWEK
jgi:hypothetical protein